METRMALRVICGCGESFSIGTSDLEKLDPADGVESVMRRAFAHASVRRHTLQIQGEVRAEKRGFITRERGERR